MTDIQLAEFYSNLLIIQYSNLPNATKHIQALALSILSGQVFTAVQNAYTLGTAVGAQLQVIGKYAGVVNYGLTTQGIVTLDDADFTKLIQIAALRNTSDGTYASLVALLNDFFPGSVYVIDNLNMGLSYIINSNGFSDTLIEVALSQNALPKNMGVQLAAPAVTPTPTTNFGFFSYRTAAAYFALYGTYNYNNTGFNRYATSPWTNTWLSYSAAI